MTKKEAHAGSASQFDGTPQREIAVDPLTPDVIAQSWNENFHIWFRNMVGNRF